MNWQQRAEIITNKIEKFLKEDIAESVVEYDFIDYMRGSGHLILLLRLKPYTPLTLKFFEILKECETHTREVQVNVEPEMFDGYDQFEAPGNKYYFSFEILYECDIMLENCNKCGKKIEKAGLCEYCSL